MMSLSSSPVFCSVEPRRSDALVARAGTICGDGDVTFAKRTATTLGRNAIHKHRELHALLSYELANSRRGQPTDESAVTVGSPGRNRSYRQ